eukprot:12977970-Alexandrium_andersonii.AAC.3
MGALCVCSQVGFFLSEAATLESRFLIAALPLALVLDDGSTLDDLHRAVRFQWECALNGKWPTTDHLGQELAEKDGPRRYAKRGTPLAGPWRLAFMGIQADYKYAKETFKLRAYDQMYGCCQLCKADKVSWAKHQQCCVAPLPMPLACLGKEAGAKQQRCRIAPLLLRLGETSLCCFVPHAARSGGSACASCVPL